MKTKIKRLAFTGLLMILGLLIFKYLPMYFFGPDILFDASAHVIITSFILYFLYLLIEKNKDWRTQFFIFALAVLTVVSIERIVTHHHDFTGLSIGYLISILSIVIPRWKDLKKK